MPYPSAYGAAPHPVGFGVQGPGAPASGAWVLIAVGTPITGRPPHRTVRAAFPHTAPTSGV